MELKGKTHTHTLNFSNLNSEDIIGATILGVGVFDKNDDEFIHIGLDNGAHIEIRLNILGQVEIKTKQP